MARFTVLVSGPKISQDLQLVISLQKNAKVLRNGDNSKIGYYLGSDKVDVLVLEIASEWPEEIEIVQAAKEQDSNVKIILINGKRELVAKAINYGVSDVFRKPYLNHLLVERVEYLLSETG